MYLWKWTAVVILTLLGHSSAAPALDDHHVRPSLISSSATSLDAEYHPRVPNSNPVLRKRFRADLGLGWTLELHDWDLLWPIEETAEIFQHFHSMIWYTVARNILNQEPQLHSIAFRYGALQLRFDCVQAPIEWDRIGSVALLITDAASQGWQGTYHMTLRNRARGLVVTAALSILWYGAGG